MVLSSSSDFFFGIGAAVFAPFLMVVGFMIWDDHWTKKKGSAFSLNMFKCNVTALCFLLVMVTINSREETEQISTTTTKLTTFIETTLTSSIRITYSKVNPLDNEDVKFLFVSSSVGILIGDWAWIEGLRYLGARKVIVLDTLKPFLAAFAGWVVFNENFKKPFLAWTGLLLSVVGVALVGLEVENEKIDNEQDEYGRIKESGNDGHSDNSIASSSTKNKERSEVERSYYYGMYMGVSNVVLHTLGVTLTKKFGAEMTTWEINFVRFGFSGVCMLILTIVLQIRDRILQFRTDSYETAQFQSMGLDESSRTGAENYGSVPSSDIESNAALPRLYFVNREDDRWYTLPNLSRGSWIRVFLGVMFVSFMCPSLTNYAMFRIPLAMLLTLESIGPLYSLPLALIMHKECPSFRASIGALLAVTGIVLLSLQGN